jgi:hypothetical protein
MRVLRFPWLVLTAALGFGLACGGKTNGAGALDGGAGDDGTDAGADVPADDPAPPPMTSTSKVDLLFMIDNSSSMGDKQNVLAGSVPQLFDLLVKPACVDGSGAPVGANADPLATADSRYGCPAGSAPRFAPLTDIHAGIVSSSLGTFGGDVCPDTGRFDDHGHLLNLVKGGGSVAAADPSGFLAWFPQGGARAETDLAAFEADFQTMLVGVEETGCGFEAQLESWYHFLVAPDPWVKIRLDSNQQASYGTDVDAELLAERAAFLRPDSFVAVIVVTDEDDSGVDPLSIGGQGWAFGALQFPGSPVFRADGKTTTAPRGTSVCQSNPLSPDCTSCGYAQTCNASDSACQNLKNDPNCQDNGGYFGPNEDQLNARWSWQRVKPSYGIDPQYPLARYVDGLTKPKVPAREDEHPTTTGPGGRRQLGPYQPSARCRNPLFAASLPTKPGDELCNLPRSGRTTDFIAFAVIGGVPPQLVTPAPSWTAIVGKDPDHYDFTGIDLHMIESKTPRAGLPGPGSPDTADPISGREWDTALNDLEFACVFDLPTPRTCSTGDQSCACGDVTNAPLCNGNMQIRAKAYPTVRELMVARSVGPSGVAGSLCPTQMADPSRADYGYRPVMRSLVDQMAPFLAK